MADEPEQNAAAAEQAQPNVRILTQFIRDLSFENALAQNGTAAKGQPNIQVQVNLDVRKRDAENQYEVISTYKVEARSKEDNAAHFLVELQYSGIFLIENVPNEQLHPFLMIECPRLTFPFARRVISDVTQDGGFPPINLDMIDFVQLYRGELQRRAQAEKAGQPVS